MGEEYDVAELRALNELVQARTRAAAQDAVAVVTAIVHREPRDAALVLRDWVGENRWPGSHPKMIANAILDLAATNLRTACASVGNDLSRIAVHERDGATPQQEAAARAVAARAMGKDGAVALVFSVYLAAGQPEREVVEFLTALAGICGAVTTATARGLGVSVAAVLAQAGAAAAS